MNAQLKKWGVTFKFIHKFHHYISVITTVSHKCIEDVIFIVIFFCIKQPEQILTMYVQER